MDLPYKTERLSSENADDLRRAGELLRDGETVAFPTETVYGLGADAFSPQAVERVFVAKQRPHWDPLIVHIAESGMLDRIARTNPVERELMAAFWPGPLTLLLERTAAVPDVVTAGRPRVGVRMPAHPVARKLIELAGVPVAAPSANRFGHTSPTTAQHVLDDLDGRIAAVLDGGPTSVGVESTVAEVCFDNPKRPFLRIYRPGAIDAGRLDELGIGRVESFAAPPTHVQPESLPSPGVGIRHYAPRARLQLVAVSCRGPIPEENSLIHSIDAAITTEGKLGVLLPDHWHASAADLTYAWGPWRNPEVLARRLFAGLRDLDHRGATLILCPLPEPGELRDAIRDRLEKAARP